MIGITAKPFPFLFPYFLPFPYFLVDYHFHIARPVKSKKRTPVGRELPLPFSPLSQTMVALASTVQLPSQRKKKKD